MKKAPKTKNAAAPLWKSARVKAKDILPTPNNYKIKTDLGRERLQTSLAKFGRAGTVVCNPSKKAGKYDLIDGNSRWEEVMAKNPNEVMEISVPSRALSPAEYKEMAAMFDFAKAGEVDMDRIQGELGTTKDFYAKWGLEVPMEVLEKLGSKAGNNVEMEYPEEGGGKSGKGKGKKGDPEVQDNKLVQAFFTTKQEIEFRKMEDALLKVFKVDNTTDVIYQAMLYAYKNKKK